MDSGLGSTVSASGLVRLQRSRRLFQQFVSDAAAGLSFSQDALGSSNLPYNKLQMNELLQDSCRRTRAAAAWADVHCLKRASALSKRAYQVAQRDQDQIFLDEKKLQSCSSIAQQRRTELGRMVTPTHTSTESLKTDLNDTADQVQTEDLTRCYSPTAVSTPPQSDSAISDAESWLAANCPTLEENHSQRLIQRLVTQLFVCQNEEPVSQDQPLDAQLVISALLHLSSQTSLVRSLLAEQLNSSEWRHRLMSCRILCSLRGPINKDIVNKLIHLMRDDCTEAVRRAAAETLLKHGKTHCVNTELRLKLEEGQSLQSRMEALDMMGHLKLMTAALREPVRSCFSDEVTAHTQACVTAGCLLPTDEKFKNCLMQLVGNHTTAEVRLSAIRAVGALGLSSLDVQEMLLRCVETEKEAELRLAACRLLQSCGVPSVQLHHFLLQRVQHESCPLVCREMEEMLHLCRLQEEHTDAKFNLQVERVCGSQVIAEKLLLLEELQGEGGRLHPAVMAQWLSYMYMINNRQAADQNPSWKGINSFE